MPLTSLPCTMRWCVVISALKTTTQLALPALSISVSAIWGTLTVVSWEAWIRSKNGDKEMRKKHSCPGDFFHTEEMITFILYICVCKRKCVLLQFCKDSHSSSRIDEGKSRTLGLEQDLAREHGWGHKGCSTCCGLGRPEEN